MQAYRLIEAAGNDYAVVVAEQLAPDGREFVAPRIVGARLLDLILRGPAREPAPIA